MAKKRKIGETNEYCVVTESTKEQEILEAAASHLILLSNPDFRRTYSCNNEYGYDDGFRMITIKKEHDYGAQGILHNTKNKKDASSLVSSTSSSSAESIKSVISVEEVEEVEQRTPVGRPQRYRSRSIVEIYSVTKPL